MGNPIFDMMSGALGSQGAGQVMGQAGFNNLNDFANMLNSRFGNMQNCLGALNGLFSKHGINPRQAAINEIKGKHFSPEVIQQFREFAGNNGATEQQINMVLNKLGLN